MMIEITQREGIRAVFMEVLSGLEPVEGMFAAEELREFVSNDLQAWCADQRALFCEEAVADMGVQAVAIEARISTTKVHILTGRARAISARVAARG